MLDKYFPLVKLSRKKSKDKPWITNGIKTSIKRRNILYRKYVERPSTESEKKWKDHKHILTNCIREAETYHYRKMLADHNNNCQNLWKIFGKILKKIKNRSNITKIKSGNETLTNPTEIANAFNKFFTNIGEELAQSHNTDDPNAFRKYLNNPILQSFNLIETSLPEIKYQMEKINPKKSTGDDDLPGKFLNVSAQIVAEPISKLFNLSIRTGKYPDVLKIAKVLPIYKKSEHS